MDTKRKLLIIPLAVILIAFTACGGSGEEKPEEPEKKEETVDPESLIKEEPRDDEGVTQEDKEAMAQVLLKGFQDEMEDLGEVKFEFDGEKPTYTIHPSEDIASAIREFKENPTAEMYDNWVGMRDSFADLSMTFGDQIKEPTAIQLADPDNPDEMVLRLNDGFVEDDIGPDLLDKALGE